jgi:hypothetical protein
MTINGGSHSISTMSFSTGSTFTTNVDLSLATSNFGNTTINVGPAATLTMNTVNTNTAPRTINKGGDGALTITGTQTHFNGTAINVNAGTLNMNSSGGTTLTINANSTTNFGATQQLAAVNVGPNATASVVDDATAKVVLNTGTMSIDATGRIDLENNKLLTNTPVGTFDGAAYNGVQGEVARAYNFGAWDQPGLMTSQELAGPNAGPLSGTTTVGVATGEQILFLAPTDTGVFAGQTITGATTIAMYTYAGDVNFDGLVDAADYGVIDNWVQFPGTDGYANGDLNYDGVIDAADYGIIDNTIQLQGAPFPGVNDTWASGAGASLSGVTAVPEPASFGVLAIAGAGLLGRRRRSR